MVKNFASLLDTNAANSVRSSHVLLTNSIAAILAAFMTTAINVALPDIQKEFSLGALQLGWLSLGYMLTLAMFIVTFVRVGDRFGRRLVFLGGLVIYAVSSIVMAFVDSYSPLLALRLCHGLGASMMFSTSMAMVTLAFPAARRGWAMGVSVAAAYLGMTLGPGLGGVMVDFLQWRSLFVLSGSIAVLNLALDLWLLGRAEWKGEKVPGTDWVGSLVYAAGLAALLIGLSLLPSASGLVLVLSGICGLTVFVWWESRVPNPVIEVRLFRHNRVFALSNLAALISYASVWGQNFLMPLYLVLIKGLAEREAGLLLVAGVALQCLISPFAGRLSDRIEPRWVASWGMLLCVAGLLMFGFLQADTPYWYVILALCILGVGYAFFSGPNQSSIMGSVEKRYIGFASGSISAMRTIGIALSVAGATLVMAAIIGRHDITPADYPKLLTAIRTTFMIYAGLCALGIVVSLVRGKVLSPNPPPAPDQPI